MPHAGVSIGGGIYANPIVQSGDQFGSNYSSGLSSAVKGLSTDSVNTSAQKTGVSAQDLLGLLSSDLNSNDTMREWLTSFQGGQQDTNNLYSLMEMIFANDLSQTNADKANQVARENADLAFLRQKELDKAAMDFNAEQAQIARDYETEMSNTAYQRVVQDLKKAGLNPILAYSNGAASTPKGGSATFGGSSAQQASSYYAQTQRQQIDQQSKASIIREYISAVSRLGSSALSSVKDLFAFL